MQSDLEQRIASERALITALDSTLDSKRTPFLKGQLRFAGHLLDDAVEAMHLADKAEPNYAAMWFGFAEMSIQMATQKRQKVQVAVDKYGGPEHVIEIGG